MKLNGNIVVSELVEFEGVIVSDGHGHQGDEVGLEIWDWHGQVLRDTGELLLTIVVPLHHFLDVLVNLPSLESNHIRVLYLFFNLHGVRDQREARDDRVNEYTDDNADEQQLAEPQDVPEDV